MKLKLFLVNVNKFGKITLQLDEKKYPPEIRRDDDNGRDFFVARQHCKIEAYTNFFIPAFKILFDDGDEPANYTLATSADKNDTLPEKLQHSEDLFFQHYEKDRDHSDGEQIKSLGFEPGVSYIFVLKNGEIFGQPHKIFIIPSSMTEKEFTAMINEMLYIRSELISRHTKTLVGLPLDIKKDSEKFSRYLQRRIHELCKVIKKINLHPRQKLSKIPTACKAEKLRKFDSKIMRQYITNPQRTNYLFDGDEVSLNIFENRFLLNKLHQLRNKIAENAVINKNNFNSDRKNILQKISEELNTNFDSAETALEALEYISDELKNKLNVLNQKFADSLKVKHQQKNKSVTDLEIFFRKIKNAEIIFNGGVEISLTPYWMDGKYGKYTGAKFCRKDDKSTVFWNEIIIATDDISAMATLTKYILDNDSESETKILLKGQLEFQNTGKNSYIIKIFSLQNFTNIENEMNYDEAVQFLKDMYIDETLEIERQKIANLKKNLETNKQNLQDNAQSKNFTEQLDGVLQLPMFDTVENKIERWRMTQIFTNDNNYHKAYKILKHLDEVLDFSFQADKENLLAKNLDKIYEYWILAKIVEHLVLKLNFKVYNSDDVVKIFNDFFDEQKTDSSACINLSRQDMTIKLFYDTPINQIFKNTTRKFKPDYLFYVRKKNLPEKIFILDAKYRNYSTMGDGYWLFDDLKGVCLDKYVDEIFKALDKKTAMSFVVHSDKNHDDQNYLGKYVVYNGTVDKRCNFLNEDKKFIENGNEQQFGSFYLLPNTDDNEINRSEENLKLFFEMIFEYFMDDWQGTCWQCGATSDNINVKKLSTAGGFPKYHMTCKKCGAFWVKNHCYHCREKLIKHLTNYHVDKNKEEWYVTCPKCGK